MAGSHGRHTVSAPEQTTVPSNHPFERDPAQLTRLLWQLFTPRSLITRNHTQDAKTDGQIFHFLFLDLFFDFFYLSGVTGSDNWPWNWYETKTSKWNGACQFNLVSWQVLRQSFGEQQWIDQKKMWREKWGLIYILQSGGFCLFTKSAHLWQQRWYSDRSQYASQMSHKTLFIQTQG